MNRSCTLLGLLVAILLPGLTVCAQAGDVARLVRPQEAPRYGTYPGLGSPPGNRVITWDMAAQNGIAINRLVGAERFYNAGVWGQASVAVNVEAGHIWNGHETLPGVQDFYTAPGALDETDWHATCVGMVIAGFDPNADPWAYPYYKLGMAPSATLSSGAIATRWYNATDPDTGQQNVYFDITPKTFYSAYAHYFQTPQQHVLNYPGISITFDAPTDVINSSWGYDDPLSTDRYTMAADGLARANPHTTLVLAAGNSTTPTNPSNNVIGPASACNAIAVGGVGNFTYNDFSTVAEFSSRGPQDYYDSVHGRIANVRAPVSLVAPATTIVAAYYGGQTGGNGSQLATTQPDPTLDPNGVPGNNWYAIGLAGTSFAAPTVSGGVSLLCSASYLTGMGAESRDSRVIKAVLMNSATKLPGWDNGQRPTPTGVVVTTQSVDWAQGAGLLNLDRGFDQYLSGTCDVPGTAGGLVLKIGWDYGDVELLAHNDYRIEGVCHAGDIMDVTLAWFRNRGAPVFVDNPDPDLQSLTTADLGFANLDLEIWDINFTTLYATSMSEYNNVEHLHFTLPLDGEYSLRVTYADQVFGTVVEEGYGLAWNVVPEPAAWVLLLSLAAAAAALRRPLGRGQSHFRRTKIGTVPFPVFSGAQHSMSKTTLNFVVDAAALAAIMLLGASGVLMRYVLPPGSGHFSQLWGMDRHQWGQIHFWIAVALLGALALHLFLHWRWVVCTVKGRPGRGSAIRVGLAIAGVLALVGLMGAPFFAPVEQTGEPPRKLQSSEHSADPTYQINGSMTLHEVEEQTGVSAAVILRELGLPADLPTDERLGRLRKQHGFEMHDVQEIVRKHHHPE